MRSDPSAVLVLILTLYFVPSLIALIRGRTNTGAIIVLNVFLGWTLVGWVVSLVWAVATDAANARETITRPAPVRIVAPTPAADIGEAEWVAPVMNTGDTYRQGLIADLMEGDRLTFYAAPTTVFVETDTGKQVGTLDHVDATRVRNRVNAGRAVAGRVAGISATEPRRLTVRIITA